jgi:DNA ligase-1
LEGNRYRVISGLDDGAKVISDWQYAESKNVGKVNETDPISQAKLEVEAMYTKQRAQGGYFDSLTDIENETYFKPMLAVKFKDIKSWNFKKQEYFVQPKLDGLRCVARASGLFSRNGKEIVSSPHIHEQLATIWEKAPNLIIDGELYNHLFKEDFNTIQSLVNQKKPTLSDFKKSRELVEYHIYDFCDGTDLSFEERFLKYSNLLKETILNQNPECMIKLVSTTQVFSLEDIDQAYGEYLSDKYEGQMVRANQPYENKRCKSLIKRKEFFDSEYKLLQIEEGTGNWAGKAKTVICQLDNGVEFRATIKGTMEELERLLHNKVGYEGSTAQATIRYPNLTPDGKPRFGVVTALWPNGRDM